MFWKVRDLFFQICIYKLGTDILGILLVEKTNLQNNLDVLV